MSLAIRCENCTAWKHVTGYMGECHALPPIADVVSLAQSKEKPKFNTEWPPVRDGDWCRDGFQARS